MDINKEIKTFGGIFLVVLLASCLTEQDKIGKRNLENITRVSLGMDTIQVKEIMGNPENRWRSLNNKFVFDYVTPSGSSEYIAITFDTLTYKVVDKGRQYKVK